MDDGREEAWEEEVDELLRGMRDDVPEMDARAFAAGRARLLAVVGAPGATGSAPEDDAVVRVLPADPRRRSPPLRRAAPWLGVAAAVVVVAAGAVALLPGATTPGGGAPAGSSTATNPTTNPATNAPANPSGRPDLPGEGRPGGALAAMPAEPLNTAGDLADKAADFPLEPGQVHYVRSSRSQAKNDSGPGGTEVEELWIPFDLDAEWMQRLDADGEIQGRGEQGLDENRAKGGRFDGFEAPLPISPGDAAAMPRDTAELYEQLRTQANADLGQGAGSTLTSAEDALGEVFNLLADSTNTVPADLRAALLRTLGYLPDVTVRPDVTSSDGRPAVAMSYALDDSTYRNEVLLDPATARPIEWRNISIKKSSGFPPGKQFTTDLRTEAAVAKLGQR
jgi:hypothetical protein